MAERCIGHDSTTQIQSGVGLIGSPGQGFGFHPTTQAELDSVEPLTCEIFFWFNSMSMGRSGPAPIGCMTGREGGGLVWNNQDNSLSIGIGERSLGSYTKRTVNFGSSFLGEGMAASQWMHFVIREEVNAWTLYFGHLPRMKDGSQATGHTFPYGPNGTSNGLRAGIARGGASAKLVITRAEVSGEVSTWAMATMAVQKFNQIPSGNRNTNQGGQCEFRIWRDTRTNAELNDGSTTPAQVSYAGGDTALLHCFRWDENSTVASAFADVGEFTGVWQSTYDAAIYPAGSFYYPSYPFALSTGGTSHLVEYIDDGATPNQITVAESVNVASVLAHTVSATDTITVSETSTESSAHVLTRTAADAVTVLESSTTAAVHSHARSATETVTVSESQSIAHSGAASVSAAETVTVSESQNIAHSGAASVSVTETVTVGETTSLSASRAISVTETVTVSETSTAGSAFSISVVETIGGSGVDNGLVSYWKADETSGTRADNETAGNDLVLAGTTPSIGSTTGFFGSAPAFLSANDNVLEINKASQTGLDSDTFTLAFWISSTDSFGTSPYVIAFYNGTGQAWTFRMTASGDLRFWVNGTTAVDLRAGLGTWTTDTGWHHVVLIFDSAAQQEIYFDGISEATAVSPPTTTFSTSMASAADFTVGNRDTSTASKLAGSVDEIGFWNRVLTPTEIASLYNSGSGLQRAGMGGGISEVVVVNHQAGATSRTATEPVTVSESATRSSSYVRTATESITVGESQSVAATGAIARAATETVTIGESDSRTMTIVRPFTEAVTASESQSLILPGLSETATDTITVSESITLRVTAPIANRTFVENKIISTTENLGVVAFEDGGIGSVVFNFGAGDVTVTNMSLNPTTGIWEYHTPFDPSAFSDGPVSYTITVNPAAGNGHGMTRVFTGQVYADSGGSLPTNTYWVDGVGGSLADGSQANPFQYIGDAIVQAATDLGTSDIAGVTINLTEGNHALPGLTVGAYRTTSTYVTVQGAPGTDRDLVVINDASTGGSDGIRLTYAHYKDLTVDSVSLTSRAAALGDSMLWADNVRFTGTGPTDTAFTHESGSWSLGCYYTDCHVDNRRDGYVGRTDADLLLARNCTGFNIGADWMHTLRCAVGCDFWWQKDAGAAFHEDWYQHTAGNTIRYGANNEFEDNNIVVYSCRGVDIFSQGIFVDDDQLTNAAFVNVVVDTDQAANHSLSRPCDHFLLWHCTLAGANQWNWRGDYTTGGVNPWPWSNIDCRNTSFPQTFFSDSATSSQVNFTNCHFEAGTTFGTNPTSGAPGFTSETSNDFTPTNTGALWLSGVSAGLGAANYNVNWVGSTSTPHRGAWLNITPNTPLATDVVTISESVVVTYVQGPIEATDTVTVSESVVVDHQVPGNPTRSTTEAVTVSEAEAHVAVLSRSFQDALTVAESSALTRSTVLSITETVSISEATDRASATVLSISEAVTVGEVAGIARSHTVTASEAVTVGEGFARAAVFARVASDVASVAEASTVDHAVPGARVATETVTVAETADVQVPVQIRTAIETVTVSESRSVLLSHEVAATETIGGMAGLVSLWRLDDASGNRVDSYGQNDLTIAGTAGAVSSVAGKIGNATDVDPATGDAELTISDASQVGLDSEAFSFSAWIKWDGATTPSTQLVAAKASSSDTTHFWQVFLSPTTGQLRFNFGDGTTFPNQSLTSSMTSGAWHHIAVRRDPAGGGSYAGFYDGIKAFDLTGVTGTIGNTGPFSIANRWGVAGGTTFSGSIDAAAYFDRSLSDSAISRLYNGGSGTESITGILEVSQVDVGKHVSEAVTVAETAKVTIGQISRTEPVSVTETAVVAGAGLNATTELITVTEAQGVVTASQRAVTSTITVSEAAEDVEAYLRADARAISVSESQYRSAISPATGISVSETVSVTFQVTGLESASLLGSHGTISLRGKQESSSLLGLHGTVAMDGALR